MAGYIPYRRSLTSRARALRQQATPAERKLWYEFLRMLPEKFTRQKPIGDYIADFYCSQKYLVVEVDGDSHFEPDKSDERRTSYFTSIGLLEIRFTNQDVFNKLDGVVAEIARRLGIDA